MKRAAKPSARSRSRKKAAPSASPLPAESAATLASSELPAAPTDSRNVGEMEGALSVGLGVLFVVAALFPRSIKQLVMLSLGSGLLYRGMTGHCGVYQSMGIDTAKGS